MCGQHCTCLEAVCLCIKLDFLVLVLLCLVVLVGLPEVPLPVVPPGGLPILEEHLKVPARLTTCRRPVATVSQSVNQPVSQPVSQSVSQAVSQSIRQACRQWVKKQCTGSQGSAEIT